MVKKKNLKKMTNISYFVKDTNLQHQQISSFKHHLQAEDKWSHLEGFGNKKK